MSVAIRLDSDIVIIQTAYSAHGKPRKKKDLDLIAHDCVCARMCERECMCVCEKEKESLGEKDHMGRHS